MHRFLAYIVFLLMLGSAFAQEPKDLPPTVGITGVIIFLVIFFGLCIGSVWLWLRSEKKKKQD